MKILSFFPNSKLTSLLVFLPIVVLCSVLFGGCYSFTGSSVPDHIKTIFIPIVEDKSNFGNAQYREELTQVLVQKFRNDNTFTVVQEKSDARISVSILTITDATANVKSGELENERKVSVTLKATYYDHVKKRQIWERNFTEFQTYSVSEGLDGRDRTVRKLLQLLSENVLLAVVSGW